MPSTILIIPIFISFAVTIFLIPNWIKKAKEGGIQGRDIQKSYKVEVAEAGGITVLAGFILGSLLSLPASASAGSSSWLDQSHSTLLPRKLGEAFDVRNINCDILGYISSATVSACNK